MIGNIKESYVICHGMIREGGCPQPPQIRRRHRTWEGGCPQPPWGRRLVADINASLAREDRERLVAFTALEADADVFGIPGLDKLPAIIWKRRNLETLRRKDAKKFADNALALERMLL